MDESSAVHQTTTGRRLVGKPRLWQDWDQEADEGSARYWELFNDLIMVAAASATASHRALKIRV
jgi:hypothetical protein